VRSPIGAQQDMIWSSARKSARGASGQMARIALISEAKASCGVGDDVGGDVCAAWPTR